MSRASALVVAVVIFGGCAAVRTYEPPVAPDALGPVLEGATGDLSWWMCRTGEGHWTRIDDGTVGLEDVGVETTPDGGVRIEGVVTRPGSPAGERVVVLATTAEAPVRVLGRQDVDPQVDPVPLTERTRLPFQLAVAPGGVPVVRDERGQARLALFGVVTSEEGPAWLVVLRLTF